jgi:hypothetical protein
MPSGSTTRHFARSNLSAAVFCPRIQNRTAQNTYVRSASDGASLSPLTTSSTQSMAASPAQHDLNAPGTSSASLNSEAGVTGGIKQPSTWERVKEWFSGDKYKHKLASMGMAAFLSYGVVSNVTYGAAMTIAWITFVQQKGISPLAAGQWPTFLAFYAGLWAFQNVVRPARFALAMVMAPLYDKLLNWISLKTGQDKKLAFIVVLVCIGILTSSGLFSALYFLGGFPDGIGPFPPNKRF